MPANKKYLIKSGWIITSKLLAAFLASYIAMSALFMALLVWLDSEVVFWTGSYLSFILWIAMMLLVYQIKKAWVSWLIFAGITLASVFVLYLGKQL